MIWVRNMVEGVGKSSWIRREKVYKCLLGNISVVQF